jgi:hypothetical protein
MHIEGPWLSTTGKKKGKQKFRNSSQAQKSRDLKTSWEQMLKKHDVKPSASSEKARPLSKTYTLAVPKDRDSTSHIKSIDTGPGVAAKKESPKYTGTECIGISILHKSCLQPIFNKQSAKDVAEMRR